MADRLRLLGTRLRFGMLSGFQDYRALFTWRSWLFGWLVRLVAQVLFFALFGRLVGTPGTEHALALGSVVALGPIGALGVVSSCVAERRDGTLPFIVLSPASPVLAIAARGSYWAADGLLTSILVTLLLPWLVGLTIPLAVLPAIVAVQIVVTGSGYALALALSSVSLRRPESRLYLTAASSIAILLYASASSLGAAGGPLGLLGQLVPAWHGLAVIRALLFGQPVRASALLAELAVLAIWGAIGYLSLSVMLRPGRPHRSRLFD